MGLYGHYAALHLASAMLDSKMEQAEDLFQPKTFFSDQVALKLHGVRQVRRRGSLTVFVVVNDGRGAI
jgi:hypothetical protein